MTFKLILSAIVAFPKIISFFKEMIGFMEKTFGPNWPQVTAELEDSFRRLNQAKTVEDRVECARDLQKILKNY